MSTPRAQHNDSDEEPGGLTRRFECPSCGASTSTQADVAAASCSTCRVYMNQVDERVPDERVPGDEEEGAATVQTADAAHARPSVMVVDEYEPQAVEGGTVQRIRYVGDSDPFVGRCTDEACDYTTGKGSKKSATSALRDHHHGHHLSQATKATPVS